MFTLLIPADGQTTPVQGGVTLPMSNMSLEESNSTSNGTLCRCSDSPLVYKDMCYLHTYDSLAHQIRGVFEVILVVIFGSLGVIGNILLIRLFVKIACFF